MTDTAPDTVTLARAEYDALRDRLEDLEDILAARKAEDDERLPHAVVERLVAGEDPPLRVWREYRGLTQSALAVRAGLPQGYLSEIEAGRKPGSIAAWKALASVLAVDVDDLVGAAEADGDDPSSPPPPSSVTA